MFILAALLATGSPTVTIAGSDIEIGAVELKDAGTDTRANILAANTARTTATVVLAVQHVDASGNVLSATPVLGAGTNNIGDVDVLTVPADPFGVNADAASATGSISAKLRFIAATGIPITGTVTVGSHAVTNAGTFVVQENGAALTSLQLLDDAVYTDDAAFTPATSKLIAIGFQADETSADSVDEGDIGTPRMTLDRRARVANKCIDGPGEPVIDSYTHLAVNLAAGADQVLVASAANKQIWVYGVMLMANVAGTISIQDEDNTPITGIIPVGITGGFAMHPSGNFAMPIWKCATDKDLEIDIVTSEVDGWIDYAIVSV